jgi:hypothetical protein
VELSIGDGPESPDLVAGPGDSRYGEGTAKGKAPSIFDFEVEGLLLQPDATDEGATFSGHVVNDIARRRGDGNLVSRQSTDFGRGLWR